MTLHAIDFSIHIVVYTARSKAWLVDVSGANSTPGEQQQWTTVPHLRSRSGLMSDVEAPVFRHSMAIALARANGAHAASYCVSGAKRLAAIASGRAQEHRLLKKSKILT